MKKLRVLDLFSGIGGFSLGLERTGGFETVAFCEIEPFPRKVLAKHWPDVPCFEDVRKLTRDDIDGPVDVICGGYPCQPFSTAGRRRGKEDDRHLWPEFARLVQELRPTWVIGENVAGHISLGLDDVLSDLASCGYAARAFIIPAVAVDAKHKRSRVWIVAHSAGIGQQGQGEHGVPCDNQANSKGEAINAFPVGVYAKWRPEPGVGRVANGIPGRVDRLKALGNAVVPQIPEMIGCAILEAEREFA